MSPSLLPLLLTSCLYYCLQTSTKVPVGEGPDVDGGGGGNIGFMVSTSIPSVSFCSNTL